MKFSQITSPSRFRICWYRRSRRCVTKAWFLGLFVLVAVYRLHEEYAPPECGPENLVIYTVATEETSALIRLRRSARVNQLNLQVLGIGKKWIGFGQKVNLLKRELEKYRDDPNTIIMFVDAYDAIFNGDRCKILDRFHKFEARILFSAEANCWPNASMASAYPEVQNGKRFLNSGSYIGYPMELLALLSHSGIPDLNSDQLFYTRLYLKPEIRSRFGMKLDHRSELFQSLYMAINDTELRFQNNKAVMYNLVQDTVPLILHGNGPAKFFLNTVENYIPQAWNPIDGCLACLEQTITLSKTAQYPTVLIGVFVRENSPLLERFFKILFGLVYPKDRIDLFIHVQEPVFKAINSSVYNQFELYRDVMISHETTGDSKARDRAIAECIVRNNDYYFYLDSTVLLENRNVLKLLIEQNRPVVAPMLFKRSDPREANFVGAIQPEYYPPSTDILSNNRSGLWKVPQVRRSYLVRGEVLALLGNDMIAQSIFKDGDTAFCWRMFDFDVDIYVSNRHYFGTFE